VEDSSLDNDSDPTAWFRCYSEDENQPLGGKFEATLLIAQRRAERLANKHQVTVSIFQQNDAGEWKWVDRKYPNPHGHWKSVQSRQ